MPWTPSSTVVQEWGRLQVVIGGIDVTFYRNTPAQVVSWDSADPGADGACQIRFPQITGFDLPGTSVPWMREWASVEINKVLTSGEFAGVLWEGMLESWQFHQDEGSAHCLFTCIGALHQLDLYVRAPSPIKDPQRIDYAVAKQYFFDSRPHLRTKEVIVQDACPVLTWQSGAWQSAYDYVLEELQKAELEGDSWTLMMERPRQPIFKKRDKTTVHWTIAYGQEGFTADLHQDWSAAANTIYGEFSDTPDTTGRNMYWAQNIYDIHPGGSVTVAPGGGGPFYNPLAGSDSILLEFDESTAEFGTDTFNLSEVRIERFVNFGDGIDKPTAKQLGQEIIDRDADIGHYGTIVLRTDPFEGSRFEIQAGDNILVQHYFGSGPTGILFHVVGCRVNFESLAVNLTVDTKFRSLPYVYQLVQNQLEGQDPERKKRSNRTTATVDDGKIPWDDDAGSGVIPYMRHLDGTSTVEVPPNTWVTTKIVAAEGPMNIMKTAIVADLPLPYHVSVYDWDATLFLTAFVNPFTANVWRRTPKGFLIGWGQNGQRAGYHPGFESDGDPLTGVMIDEADWTFSHSRKIPSGDGSPTNSGDVSFLWVSFYHENAATTLHFYGQFIHGRTAAADFDDFGF